MSAHHNLSTTSELDNQADSLRKSYDQDINALRKMLQDARHYDNTTTTHNNSSSDNYTKLSLENCNISSSRHPLNIINNSHNTSSKCNECGDNVNKMKSERDELLRRFRQGEASRTTIEERQEIERQLHKSKNDLFRHKKKAREQLEDIEEQLEHAQNVFDEKMQEKDAAIESLSQEINKLTSSPSVRPPVMGESYCQTDNSENFRQNSISIDDLKTLDKELKRMETKCIKSEKLAEVCESKLQEEIDKLRGKYKSSEKLAKELKRNCEEAEKTIKSMRNTLEENERNIGKFQDIVRGEKENMNTMKDKVEEELNSLKKVYEADKAKYKKLKGSVDSKQKKIAGKYESTIKDFHSQVTQLQLQLDEMNHLKSKFDEERDWLKQSQKLNEDYLIEQNSKLENKLAFVQKELAEALEKNSRLENSLYEKDTDHIEKLHEQERKLKLEIDNLKEKVRNTETEYKSMASKSKESSSMSQHRDQRLASSIQEECHKLTLLCESINPATRYNSSGISSVKKSSSFSCKKSLVDLQDAVEGVCRGTNDILCEVTRLRRESKLHKESKQQQRASEEPPTFKRHLTSNGKQLKSARERFGSYDTLLRSYDFDHRSTSKVDNPWKKDTSSSRMDDSNTVKLLTRLQGRVKQLRTDNNLSKSTFHLSQTP